MEEGEKRRGAGLYVVSTMEGGKEERREGELLVTHQGLETKKPRTFPPVLPPSIHP